ncbi:unnamed protein product [Medioppia subpectinata]|uniref:Uncharacterized protein n=1 Tax=Medioppia subpectinata TaxID=1979941 RepID=A0A7R9PWP7_9ACAR|nr:unnamed protein product [Medioppia subpectinata]CAG2104013.1 unnamed protein product [Medioppia subpectinata]
MISQYTGELKITTSGSGFREWLSVIILLNPDVPDLNHADMIKLKQQLVDQNLQPKHDYKV